MPWKISLSCWKSCIYSEIIEELKKSRVLPGSIDYKAMLRNLPSQSTVYHGLIVDSRNDVYKSTTVFEREVEKE